MSHNHQKKIAVINDYSGYGRCSLAVELPIISTLKVQCCPLPTSILSNHTGFDSFYITDFTEHMMPYIEEWEKLQLSFDGICTGYLGSSKQIEIVEHFFAKFKTEHNVIVVDPVMGDHGKLYSAFTDDICQKMRRLIKHANIITPNMTEACILAGVEYKEVFTMKEIKKIAKILAEMGPKKIVITGIPRGQFISNFCYEKEVGSYMIKTMKVGTQRSGTGDIFTSIVAADAVNGVDFQKSVRRAASFVKKCILKAIEMEIPVTDGVPFEELLYKLKK